MPQVAIVEVLEFVEGTNPRFATQLALDGRRRSDLTCAVVRNEGDVLRVRVMQGHIRSPRNLFYVRRYGLFRVSEHGVRERQIMSLHAWPSG